MGDNASNSRSYTWSTPLDDAETFELAPLALFLQDFSALKRQFDAWRAEGVIDLRAHLTETPELLTKCVSDILTLKVNREALRLLGVADRASLLLNRLRFIHAEARQNYVERFVRLWEGELSYSLKTRIVTTFGETLDLVLRFRFLPGHGTDWDRALMTLEDVTARNETLRQLTLSEHYARDLFDLSPVSLWVEDYSEIKRLLDGLRMAGVEDFRAHADAHPEFAILCMRSIKVLDVNRQTLTMFEAPDKPSLLDHMQDVLPENLLPQFVTQLAALWNGSLQHSDEVINYTLAGRSLNVLLQLSIMPDHARDWRRVLVALTDITARKQAEARLEFLGRHDALTGLSNRSAFAEEIARLEGKGQFPISVFMIDLDGLKMVNDRDGHAAGDELLRRAGRLLRRVSERPYCAARLGGDEFALILPETDEDEAARLRERLGELLRRDNETAEATLRLSIGFATCLAPGCIEQAIRQADMRMYEVKRAGYAASPRDQDRRLN